MDYVLGTWTKEEADALPERLDMAGEVIRSFATAGLERTMNAFNTTNKTKRWAKISR